MKNLAKLVGIIAIVAVIGFSVVACEDDATKDALDGTTWRASVTESGMTETAVLTFSSPNFTLTFTSGGQSESMSGTYSVSGSTVTMTSDGETETATLSGNTLTSNGISFTRQ